jgi:segregation and condensation protein B
MSENELQLNPIIEAILLASPQPLSLKQMYELFAEQPIKPGSIEQALTELKSDCEQRGVELVEVASGYRYQVKFDIHPYVARLWTERQSKYTRATLETLALIAYRQPITRGEIEQIRGVSVSSSMIKSLEEREWIRVLGHRDVPGRPELFGTTKTFLDYFGLKSLDALPPLAELKEYPELEPQLSFDISEPFPAQVSVDMEPSADADELSEVSLSTPETDLSVDHVETTTDPTQT